ncbi:MAG: hypothetical protein WC846_02595 [Candidatus Gracilibacteria bacterium]|jgi:hypothetical protein
MRKTTLFLLALVVLSGIGLYGMQNYPASLLRGGDLRADVGGSVELASSDEAGYMYSVGDPCGYVMGTQAISWNSLRVDFDGVDDKFQGCVDSDGIFYTSAPDRGSKFDFYLDGKIVPFVVDLASDDGTYGASMDADGYWGGMGKIISGPVSAVVGQMVLFDWTCPSGEPSCATKFHVKTNLETGVVTGYAWNKTLGMMWFKGLTQELPPITVTQNLFIYANDTTNGPTMVDSTNAPLADGDEYWRVKVTFTDENGDIIPEEKFDFKLGGIQVEVTDDTNVYLNQVENSGVAYKATAANSVLGCSLGLYCILYEGDEWSLNTFVYSGAPTSNVLGVNDDEDSSLNHYSDRDGCRGIYDDQTGGDCLNPDGSPYEKNDVFYSRSNSRNKIDIKNVLVKGEYKLIGADRALEVVSSGRGVLSGDGNEISYRHYVSYLDEGAGNLSFRPRFQNEKFVVNYDGEEHDMISSEVGKEMTLVSSAKVAPNADGASYTVYYQADTTHTSPAPVNDNYLLLGGCSTKTESSLSGPVYSTDGADYALSFGQKSDDSCDVSYDVTAEATNEVTGPTIEQWVCDEAPAVKFGGPSCYYTGYLSIPSQYADPEDMLVMGAINSFVDQGVLNTGSADLSVLGSTEIGKMRSKMLAQILRYTLGKDVLKKSSPVELDSSFVIPLLGGKLLYTESDVVIDGLDGFNSETLVLNGGNLYINGNVTGGRLGVVALEKDGEGGNVYIDPGVTDLYANFFLDGGFFSSSGELDGAGVPVWANTDTRTDALRNQLYLNGSLVSENTVGGSADGGNIESDLNQMRTYTQCYPLDGNGVPDTDADLVACSDILPSFEYDSAASGLYPPFIVDYSPADGLPIFEVENGLFN